MNTHRTHTSLLLLALLALTTSTSTGQGVTTRLQVSKSSGFLGIGSPRFVTVRLSTPARDAVLTSEAVNSRSVIYFVIKPAENWLPDEDFFAAVVPTLRILQADTVLPLESMSPFSLIDSTLILGFSKSLRLDLPFEFMIGLEDDIFTAPLEVPSELWPAYPRLAALMLAAQESRQSGAYRSAIASIDSALLDPALTGFPQLAGLRELRTVTVVALANNAYARLDSALAHGTIPLEEQVSCAAQSADELRFAADSLQAGSLGIPAADPSIVTLAVRIRSQAAHSLIVRDSLQQQFDLARIGWIFEKGNHSKNGVLYLHIVEAIAFAFSSLDFFDTTQTSFAVELPASIQRQLEDEELVEDYDVFVRMCNDRYRHGVPLFPVEFLPTLRRDTAQHVLPVYYMLQGVSEYWAGNLDGARAASSAVLRRASDSLVINRYDMMRMAVNFRQGTYPAVGLEALAEARDCLKRGDTLGATAMLDANRNASPIAPVALLRGSLALSAGDTVGALGQYATAWLADRRAIDAYLRSAELLRARGELQRSAEILRLALDSGNDYWIVFYNLGITWLDKGESSAALLALQNALKIAPRSYETAIALGRAYQQSGDYRRAREYYNRAITFDPLRTEAVDLLTQLNRLNRPPR